MFLLRNFFIGIPKDILESARIDGANELWIFVRLMLPLGLPAIASLAIFQFLWTWNDLIVSLTFGVTADHRLDLRPAPRVRDEHRRDRARVVHLARRSRRRVFRVPALLRAGPAGGLGEVMAASGRGGRRVRPRRLHGLPDLAPGRARAGADRRIRDGERPGGGLPAPRRSDPPAHDALRERRALPARRPSPVSRSVRR